MAAYMFVLYFGIAADLTPPVALAAYAGAGIAKSDPMKTGLTATKLALAGFLVPYIYAYNPILVLVGFEWMEFAQAVVTALLGVFLLGMATIGFFRAPLHQILRILALAGALGLMIPGWKSDLAGFIILAVIWCAQSYKEKETTAMSGRQNLPDRVVLSGLVGFMAGIPLSYFFQASDVRELWSFGRYLMAIPETLRAAGASLNQLTLSDPVSLIIAVAVVCALLAALAGYYGSVRGRKIKEEK
jgi:hypothetical protein